jgi:hypothetical protein
MHPSAFIAIAESTASSGPAGARSAVSRAYYGAFHIALNALKSIGVVMHGNGTSHVKTVQCLQQLPNENAKKAGQLLGDLHSYRLKADYRLEKPFQEKEQEAAYAIFQAKEVERLLAEMLRSASPKDLKSSIVKICQVLGVAYSEP